MQTVPHLDELAIVAALADRGILRYRGYPIEQLAGQCSFPEVCYLLLNGELPSKEQLETFENTLKRHTMLHEDMRLFYNGFPRDAHPMAILGSVVGAMSTFYQDSLDPHDQEQVDDSIVRLMAKLPTIAAFAHKKSIGQPYIYPDNSLSYCANFLRMMFAVPSEKYEVDQDFVDALNLLLIVHADHEQNCSTSTVRMVGSSEANLFASISAGICALWGPRHGGANQSVIEMLEQIQAAGGNYRHFLDQVKGGKSKIRLMGFGHRVYKNFDPRARLLKSAADSIFDKLGIHDPLLELAKRIEEEALSDSYFVERKLYPNVDFYSGVIYRAMGIPTEMVTVMFVLGRLPGWIAHWLEQKNSDENRIHRPRQVYTGENEREFEDLGTKS
jgi:citrate synthase